MCPSSPLLYLFSYTDSPHSSEKEDLVYIERFFGARVPYPRCHVIVIVGMTNVLLARARACSYVRALSHENHMP